MLIIIGAGFLLFYQAMILVFLMAIYFFWRAYCFQKSKNDYGADLYPAVSGFRIYEIIHMSVIALFVIFSVYTGLHYIIKYMYLGGGPSMVYYELFFYILVLKLYTIVLYNLALTFQKKILIYALFFVEIGCIIWIISQEIFNPLLIFVGVLLLCNEGIFYIQNTIKIPHLDTKIKRLTDYVKKGVDAGIGALHYIIPGLGVFTMNGWKYKLLNLPLFFLFMGFYGVIFTAPSVLILHSILLGLSILLVRSYKKRSILIKK